jgi:virulence-associated protein VagC
MMAAIPTKLFEHDGSQAVKMPADFQLPGDVVFISRTENGVLLQPASPEFEARRVRFVSLAGACPDLADVEPHVKPDLPRDP